MDLLERPLIGRFLKWRFSRVVLQLPLLGLALLMIWQGFTGPDMAPRNAATVLTWVHYRGFLLLALLAAGNLFCMACPFMLVRNAARRLVRPRLNWPAALRKKWLAVVVFGVFFYLYEAYDLWASPALTGVIILAYFSCALAIDLVFKNASFCKYVCPIGQFNFAAATVSPLELKVREPDVCAACTTRDCIKGTRAPHDSSIVVQRGCELALFQAGKVGNMDCTLCLDCVYACPHDNIGLTTRLPGSELWSDARRSGVGLFSRRPDIAALIVIFTFTGLLNAFGMVSPVYAVLESIGAAVGTTAEPVTLGVLFALVLVVEPVLLLGAAGIATRAATGGRTSLVSVVTRFSYSLAPLGLGVWAAHHAFHFLSGLLTAIPVLQETFLRMGMALFGEPLWTLRGLPPGLVDPAEIGLLGLGGFGSLLVAWRIAERDYPQRPAAAFAPWAGLILVLWLTSVWLLAQPMEMRGMMMGN